MAKATRVNCFVVSFTWEDPETGVKWIVTDIPEGTYEEFQRLPAVVSFEGRLYGQTGWNSDRCKVYYNDDQPIAKAVK